MSLPTHTQVILSEVRRLVTLWAPRLGISERIAVEVFPSDDGEARCSMKPARMIPEAQGLWDFVLEWSESVDLDDYQHTVVHELVHLLLEPLREAYYAQVSGVLVAGLIGRHDQVWETVVQRVADAFERAYAVVEG